jgi:hypothetical protein
MLNAQSEPHTPPSYSITSTLSSANRFYPDSFHSHDPLMPLRALPLALRSYYASDFYCSTRPLELRSLSLYIVSQSQPSTHTQTLVGVSCMLSARRPPYD